MRELSRFARGLFLKYANEMDEGPEFIEPTKMELFDPNASSSEQMELFRNNLISLYEKFTKELDGDIARIEGAYKLPVVENIRTKFAELISKADRINRINIHHALSDIISETNKMRAEAELFVKSNIDDPIFTAFHMRKKVGSTIERVLRNFQIQLQNMQKNIASTTKKKLVPTEVDRRRVMKQTIGKLQRLLMAYGGYYGINFSSDSGMTVGPEFGKLESKDPVLAKELVSAMMGLDKLEGEKTPERVKAHFQKLEEEGSKTSGVKPNLKARIHRVLNPIPLEPFGKLPLKPPGRK